MTSDLDTSLLDQSKRLDEHSAELDKFLRQLSQSADDNAINRVISLYKKNIVKLEQDIWQQSPSPEDIEQYQSSFKILEKLYELKAVDTRYNFKIVIPVADRPQHLKHCLDSIFMLCQSYNYGGLKHGQYHKISVLIADDSREAGNIKQHRNYCDELTAKGINTEYFGLEEQLKLVNHASAENGNLANIISNSKSITEPLDFSHKGASIMRNITYLKLNQMLGSTEKRNSTLIYFIDSDQEFCINATRSDKNHYAINYFHYLNEIFSTQDVSILTGKVVGDPPVSPSVMAGNFQQDVYNFLDSIEKVKPCEPCQFHHSETDTKGDAAYHDMANLFGFSSHEQAFDYHCTLPGDHNNTDCFSDFANKLGRFFYGEHPTRKTFFNYGKGFSDTTPARTVYTGNYVIKPENLDFFIPFATLKLRMAGPVLGRLLKTRLQNKFVSANLPMLHNRTVDSTGQAEFRAGVRNHKQSIDLSNEFIRQFYGDVMLFSMKKLTEHGFSDNAIKSDTVRSALEATYKDIQHSYIDKHDMVLQLRAKIDSYLNNADRWWNTTATSSKNISHAIIDFNTFLNNIQTNFDENSIAYQQITSASHARRHLNIILDAILHYDQDMDNWKQALKS